MLDVEHRDPGIVINLVSRRGGNKTSLGGRFFYTDEKFQSEVPQSKLDELGIITYNRAVDMKDFGFNAGGPVIKDKIWWWAAYGVQQINTINAINVNDKTFLINYTAKVNFQLIPENRAEIYYGAGDKKKWGRDSSESFPPGYTQSSKFHFGNPTWKFQDEHMFGDNLFLSVRLGSSDAGFGMVPGNDESLTQACFYNATSGVWSSQTYFYSTRPHPYVVGQVQYFADNLFGTGTAHEMKLGIEVNNTARTYVGGYAGNFNIQYNLRGEQGDFHGVGYPELLPFIQYVNIGNNDILYDDGTKRTAVYFSDNITFGRFNVNIGVRYDYTLAYRNGWTTASLFTDSTPWTDSHMENYAAIVNDYWSTAARDAINVILPTKTAPYVESGKVWPAISPRFGINYDLFGTGKTILKLAYSLYQGTGLGIGYWAQSGMYPWLGAYWDDVETGNNDGKIDLNELYWQDIDSTNYDFYRLFDDDGNFQGNLTREYGSFWGGWDQSNPTGLVDSKSYYRDDWKPSQTHEAFVSVEHEIIQDFGASLSFTWKRMGRYSWGLSYYPLAFYPTLEDHVRSKDDYETLRNVPTTLVNPATGQTYDPGEAAGRPWYTLKVGANTLATSYSMLEMCDPARAQIYWGFDLVLNKRLSNKWMMNGSFTYQMQRYYYGESYTDPTNMWVIEGQIYGISMGGASGKVARDGFSRWMLKLTGLYQLPFDINVSGTLSAHEGYFYYTYFGISDNSLPNTRSRSNTLYTAAYDNRSRLDDVWQLNLKVEKAFKLGDTSRMYFSIDLFNVLNMDTILRKYDISLGSFRYDHDTPIVRTAPATAGGGSGRVNEIMNPFIFRLGMRFQI